MFNRAPDDKKKLLPAIYVIAKAITSISLMKCSIISSLRFVLMPVVVYRLQWHKVTLHPGITIPSSAPPSGGQA